MPASERIFVGRKTELEQFGQVLSQMGQFERRLFRFRPAFVHAAQAKARLFLPHGIGGIGKTELGLQCLGVARKAGWQTLAVDWDKLEYWPAEPVDVMNAIAVVLRGVAGERAIHGYLDERN